MISLRPVDDARSGLALIEAGLTDRQAEVAIALAESGGSNAELSVALGITQATVRKHLEAVFATLGVTSRAAAVVAVNKLLRR